jgi:putative ABC transport system permease protein
MNRISGDYFKSLGIPLLTGRNFTDDDGRAVGNVAIVNEKAAAHLWPHEDAVGKHILMQDDYKVVGVVKDTKYMSLRDAPPMAVYLPRRAPFSREMKLDEGTLHARIAGNPTSVIGALMREVHRLDANVPIYNVTTMDAQLGNSIAIDRLMAALTALFGVLAVVLAATGLYGVMAFTVAKRTREIGIRMALGADGARVLRQVVGKSAVLALSGIALGIPAALWASRATASFLYGLSPTDPLIYAALAALLAGVALSAAWIPARRASRVDPMVALRYE